MSKVVEAGYDNIRGVSDMDKKTTKEEFAKSLTRSLRQFAPVLLGNEEPKSNARDFIEEMKKWDEEIDEIEQ